MDETTPHMHLCSVPLTEDERLSTKTIFNRKALFQLQSELPNHLQSKGFDVQRGESGSKKTHLDTQDFKIKNKQEELKKSKIEFNKAYNELNLKSKTLENLTTNISNLEQTNVRRSLIGSKITLQKVDFNKIMSLAKKGVLSENSLNELKNINLFLKSDVLSYHKGFTEYFDKNEIFKKENKVMASTLEKLKNEKDVERVLRRFKREDLDL